MSTERVTALLTRPADHIGRRARAARSGLCFLFTVAGLLAWPGRAAAWDTLTHLAMVRDHWVKITATGALRGAGFRGDFPNDAYEAGALAPDILVAPSLLSKGALAGRKAADSIESLVGGLAKEFGLPPPKAPKPPGPSSDELDRVASLDKEVGVPHFHDPYFAKRLWDTAKNPATRNARLAAFSLGWCVHVACDHAFDATKDDPKLMLNLNKTALTRFAFLVLAWDDARWLKGFKDRDGKDHKPLAVAKVATRAQDRPGVITEFAKDIVATFRTRVPKEKQDLLNEQDLDVARLREYLTLLAASADGANRVATREAGAKRPELPGPLADLLRPLLSLPNEWRVNDTDLVATRVVERALFGNEDDPVRAEDDDLTLAQVLAVYASDARATAIARILLFQCFPTRPVPW